MKEKGSGVENPGYEQILAAASFIKDRLAVPTQGAVGVVLGSGLGAFADELSEPQFLPYAEIPHFPQGSVSGHSSRLVLGKVGQTPVLAMQGRVHMYEGYTPQQVVLPVRVLMMLGVKVLIITNAAGGISSDLAPGDLMLIADHLNLSCRNPLVGDNDERMGPRFPDMSDTYAKRLREIAQQVAEQQQIELKSGVYAGLLGPSYETPAEIRMLGVMGANAVGMSTVPEVIACGHGGAAVLGISCITNLAAGISQTPLDHAEVKETADRVRADFVRLLHNLVPAIA